jgi:hypothetical protein
LSAATITAGLPIPQTIPQRIRNQWFTIMKNKFLICYEMTDLNSSTHESPFLSDAPVPPNSPEEVFITEPPPRPPNPLNDIKPKELKKRGRKPIYATDEERHAAKLRQTK